ncbi:IS66 family insertion sequence element accessory protein TnpB [Sinorhizobium sp. 6-70]|nr:MULTISPECIES: IS66 family insertion sequence element accessory protein TnpB [unclassified Sinorhizobium]MDK1378730.1 IS66 family insertion sequence element accessory protein TnpB [Sinorhizobium sp. 6-70]MDK1482429.1 IS66 family insertion sequence element accessory protein TnpB [Sinorhizobium sp. 6-117]
MFKLGADLKVYLHREPIDFRAGINSLAVLVQETMALDPFAPAVFAFCNRRRDWVKLPFFDRSGFVLVLKRLTEDKFRYPRREAGVVTLTATPISPTCCPSTSPKLPLPPDPARRFPKSSAERRRQRAGKIALTVLPQGAADRQPRECAQPARPYDRPDHMQRADRRKWISEGSIAAGEKLGVSTAVFFLLPGRHRLRPERGFRTRLGILALVQAFRASHRHTRYVPAASISQDLYCRGVNPAIRIDD